MPSELYYQMALDQEAPIYNKKHHAKKKRMKCKNLKVYLPSVMQNRTYIRDAYGKEEKESRKKGKKMNWEA